jgi:hypothetical protein
MFLIAAGDSGPAADGTAPDDTEED